MFSHPTRAVRLIDLKSKWDLLVKTMLKKEHRKIVFLFQHLANNYKTEWGQCVELQAVHDDEILSPKQVTLAASFSYGVLYSKMQGGKGSSVVLPKKSVLFLSKITQRCSRFYNEPRKPE